MKRFSGSVVVFWSCSALAGCGGVAHSLGGNGQNEGSSGGEAGAGGEGTRATGGENWGATAAGGETAVGGAGGQDYGGVYGAGGTAEGSGAAPGCGAYGAGADVTYCQGMAGSPGTAGGAGFCDPAACPTVSPPDLTINIPGCCLPDGACGVDGSLASIDGVPIDPSCHAYNEPGVDTAECPTTIPVQGASPLPGCCTPSGICGVDMGLLNLGCVPRAMRDPSGASNVPPIYCQYPHPTQATGGSVGYGGYYYGGGGVVSYGGYGAAGGYDAAGGAGGDPTGIGGAGGVPMLQTGGSAPTPATGGSAF